MKRGATVFKPGRKSALSTQTIIDVEDHVACGGDALNHMGVGLFRRQAKATSVDVEHHREGFRAVLGGEDVQNLCSVAIGTVGDMATQALRAASVRPTRGQLTSHRSDGPKAWIDPLQ